MKAKNQFLIAIIVLISFSCNNQNKTEQYSNSRLKLWYDEPAMDWTEALPVGNGRMAAMIYGGSEKEVIQFNEETLWSGSPNDYANNGSHQYLDTLREMLWLGKQDEAEELANKKFMSKPLRQMAYLPFGNIVLDFPDHENPINYKRQLDLENAISTVSYEVDGVKFKREVLASNPAQTIVTRLETDEEGALNLSIGLNSPHTIHDVSVVGDVVILKGKAMNYYNMSGKYKMKYPDSDLTFEARLKVIHDGGELKVNEQSLQLSGAKTATLYLVAATSFVDYTDISANPEKRCLDYMDQLKNKSYKSIRKEHIQDYTQLFNRVSLELGSTGISARPTNDRLISFNQDQDPDLVALLFQYGRYLLISSSRPGTQPANLQGIWNDRLNPSWSSKYTININTEMNYWPAEITNLSECVKPLIAMAEDLAITGKKVAKEHYNMNGWVTHHNTDLWRGAAPINNANHGIWVTGGAWICQHIWWHYQFTGDVDYLRNTAYPILKEASRFFTEYLVPDTNNPEWLISGPSNSPEIGGLVMGPIMDHQIIRNLFENTISAAEILGEDADFVNLLKEKHARIAPNQIGKHGQLQEWLTDVDDPDNQHRHVSHLWGLHPGHEISPITTPELADACRVTLSHRGDEGTGWSRAWKINFWARLHDGDHSFLILKNLILPSKTTVVDDNGETISRERGGLYVNLFDAHPPFQIDGNFGATSGIAEMLMQSHEENTIRLLPALPSALPNGKITGLKARGNFEVDIFWEDSKLTKAIVYAPTGGNTRIVYQDRSEQIELKAGEKYVY